MRDIRESNKNRDETMNEVELIITVVGPTIDCSPEETIILLTIGDLEGEKNPGKCGRYYASYSKRFPLPQGTKLKGLRCLYRHSYSIKENLANCFLKAFPFFKDEQKIWEQISISHYSLLERCVEKGIVSILKESNYQLLQYSEQEIIDILRG